MEQRVSPSFEDTDDELEALLLAGVNSPEIPEEEFWASLDQTTDTIIAEHKIRAHRESFLSSERPRRCNPPLRYHLVTMALSVIALRFREAVKDTATLLREHPLVGSRHPLRNPDLKI